MAKRLGICKFCDREFETESRGSMPKSCPQCRAEDYRQRYYRRYSPFGSSAGNVKQVLQRAKGKCEICHQKKRLYIHHKDGNGLKSHIPNHSIVNLMAVCAKCHMKEHGLQKAGRIDEIKRMRKRGMTFQSMGDKYGVSRQRIHQLLQRG